jgi:hypothetical protein
MTLLTQLAGAFGGGRVSGYPQVTKRFNWKVVGNWPATFAGLIEDAISLKQLLHTASHRKLCPVWANASLLRSERGAIILTALT